MFIASKYEDIYPIKLKVLYEKIGHWKLSVEDLKEMEFEILKTLNFEVRAPTVLDFVSIYMEYALLPTVQVSSKDEP